MFVCRTTGGTNPAALKLKGHMHTLRRWLQTELPELHNAAVAGKLTPDEMHTSLAPQIETFRDILEPAIDGLDRRTAQQALQLLAFPVASLERVRQADQAAPGVALGRLPSVERVLDRLGDIADWPPQNSHYTYWLQNDGPDALSFTGDSQEFFFGRVVNQQARLQGRLTGALRPICTGDVDVESDAAIDSLNLATSTSDELFMGHYRNFTRRGRDGQPGMTGEFFRTRFRTNLVPIPICGVLWEGPNATNIKEQPQVDHLTFGADPWYAEVIRSRFRHYSREDREAVDADLHLPSALDRYLERLQLTREDATCLSGEKFQNLVAKQSDGFRKSLASFKRFFTSTSRVSNLHAALICEWLDADLSEARKEPGKLTIASNVGVSGTPLKHALDINNTRTKHPLMRKLLGLRGCN